MRALAYVLGHITNCCQSIGGHSDQCVIDGITRPNNGFLVLLKDESSKLEIKDVILTEKDIDVNKLVNSCKVVGQGYFWKSKLGNLTIDSWENLHAAADDIAVKLLTRYAEDVVYQEGSTILQVTIGEGGKTPKDKFPQKATEETMLEGTQYPDSFSQKLIFFNEKIQEKLFSDICQEIKDGVLCEPVLGKKILESAYPVLRKEQFCSYQQVEALKTLFKNNVFQDHLKIKDNRHMFGIHLQFNGSIWILLKKLIELNLLTHENIKKTSFKMRDARYTLHLTERISLLSKLGQLSDELYNILIDTPSIWHQLSEPQSILHGAARIKSITLVKAMLKCGADVNEKDIHGNTPLHLAMTLHRVYNAEEHVLYLEFVQEFLTASADVNFANHAGKTPLQLAIENNDDKLVKLLQKASKPAPRTIGFFAEQVNGACKPQDEAKPAEPGFLQNAHPY